LLLSNTFSPIFVAVMLFAFVAHVVEQQKK
jgi:hypothetical protein